ncbi:MAG: PP2C family protein-serine/threonine phosphatase [Cetobacterium sp.]|uniref:PP2C family protein-serine/threonine phosphatase n=1 Tax=Cetobacterium sp. TaxID=2071632 RepID=UPI003EE6B064
MEIYYCTQIGNRKKNEDSLLINKLLINTSSIRLKKYSSINKITNKFILCDGMGGHSSGEIASKIVLETFFKSFRKVDFNLIQKLLYHAREKLNYYAMINNINHMGTTISGVILSKNNNIIFNVGDTRIYKISKGSIIQLSKDHSYAQELCDKGVITKEYIPHHQSRHILTSSVSGGQSSSPPNIFFNTFDFIEDDILFICTDGVWEQLTEEKLLQIFNRKKIFKESLKTLSKIIEIYPNDNISFIAIKK